MMSKRLKRDQGEPIAPPIRERLGKYFPDLDLETVRLHEGIPRYVLGRPAGYVNRHRIYLASCRRDPTAADFLALLAHEFVHVRQYRELGAWRFRWAYLREYLAGRLLNLGHEDAYRRISFEREARDVEERVRRELLDRGPPANPVTIALRAPIMRSEGENVSR